MSTAAFERENLVLTAVNAGLTFAQIAKQVGASQERVRQIWIEASRRPALRVKLVCGHEVMAPMPTGTDPKLICETCKEPRLVRYTTLPSTIVTVLPQVEILDLRAFRCVRYAPGRDEHTALLLLRARESGLTYRQIAEASGLSVPSVSKIVRREREERNPDRHQRAACEARKLIASLPARYQSELLPTALVDASCLASPGARGNPHRAVIVPALQDQRHRHRGRPRPACHRTAPAGGHAVNQHPDDREIMKITVFVPGRGTIPFGEVSAADANAIADALDDGRFAGSLRNVIELPSRWPDRPLLAVQPVPSRAGLDPPLATLCEPGSFTEIPAASYGIIYAPLFVVRDALDQDRKLNHWPAIPKDAFEKVEGTSRSIACSGGWAPASLIVRQWMLA